MTYGLSVSETLLSTMKLIINSNTTKWSLLLYTLIHLKTSSNHKYRLWITSKNTHTQHDKSIPALIELVVLNDNGSKMFWYLCFIGLGPAHSSKINQKTYTHCYSSPENNIMFSSETCLTLFRILKGHFENNQKSDWLM